jgi:hypothetical protein
MSDMITGVLVLQESLEPGIFNMWFQYTRHDGMIGHSHIPMKRAGTPQPESHFGPVWDFVEDSPFLHCSPSVRILGPSEGAPDHFHNQGQWTNYYVWMANPLGSEPNGYELCQQINKLPTKEERDQLIFSLRDKKILL